MHFKTRIHKRMYPWRRRLTLSAAYDIHWVAKETINFFLLSISARGGYILLPVLIKLQVDFGNRYSVENIDYQTIRKHRRLVLLTTVAIAGGVKAHLEKLA